MDNVNTVCDVVETWPLEEQHRFHAMMDHLVVDCGMDELLAYERAFDLLAPSDA